MLLLGRKTKTEQVGEQVMHCNRCERETPFTLMRSETWLTIFFIPITTIGIPVEYAYCGVCGTYLGEQEDLAAEPEAPGSRQCPGCGEWVKAEAFACRSCGRLFTDAEVRESRRQAAAATPDDPDDIQKRLQR